MLTELGKAVAFQAVRVSHVEEPEDIDWVKSSFVVRAKDRRIVLEEIGRPTPMDKGGKTVVEIRERLRDKYPIGIYMVHRGGEGTTQCWPD